VCIDQKNKARKVESSREEGQREKTGVQRKKKSGGKKILHGGQKVGFEGAGTFSLEGERHSGKAPIGPDKNKLTFLVRGANEQGGNQRPSWGGNPLLRSRRWGVGKSTQNRQEREFVTNPSWGLTKRER